MTQWSLHILEKPEEMRLVEDLQRRVWPGNETEIVPAHILLAVAHNGGLVVGAYSQEQPSEQGSNRDPEGTNAGSFPDEAQLIGFVFSFPGTYDTADGARLKHHSHMLGVDPAYRDQGIGFALKRAQWQMTRHQGVDRITWTYDPLLSRNAYLNISRLGAVCNTYLRDEYGELRDRLNTGLSTDRFQVDWWVNTNRVNRRLSKRPRLRLDLAHFLAAGTQIVNPSRIGQNQLPYPATVRMDELALDVKNTVEQPPMFLVEIPANFHWIKAADLELAQFWRMHTRELFESLFALGYLVTDFVYLPGALPRSFYVLSYGQSSL